MRNISIGLAATMDKTVHVVQGIGYRPGASVAAFADEAHAALLRACLRTSTARPHLSRVATQIPLGGAEERADVDGPASDAP